MKKFILALGIVFLFCSVSFAADYRLVGYEHVYQYNPDGSYNSDGCILGKMSRVGVWKTYRAIAQRNGPIAYLKFFYAMGPDTQLEWAAYRNNGNTPGEMIAHGLHWADWNGTGEYNFSANRFSSFANRGEYIWLTVYVDMGDRVLTGRCGRLCLSEGDSLKMGAQRFQARPPLGSDFNFYYGPNCYAWSLWYSDTEPPPPPPPPLECEEIHIDVPECVDVYRHGN